MSNIRIKLALLSLGLFLSTTASAQIVICAMPAQEVFTQSPILLAVLAVFLIFIVRKIGKLKGTQALLFLYGIIAINGFYFIQHAEAGGAGGGGGITLNDISGSNCDAGHPINNGSNNSYQNNSGVTLTVISISLPAACSASTAPIQTCTTGLSLANGDSCGINCQ
ncbi:hypothetical protein [uncultured Pseudoteredinibacter sp.]|uniref:hypothetical protein n=1 Tax=uncultured Pseudoteredinibacter sp. TaxID=1641701 RepID=UPI002624EB9A|nr:hypothetical protein [uncultured Pseudoteredinibacter sp.]